MGFENFFAARDFIYLFALLMGSGAGFILLRFRKVTTIRFRNIAVTVGFCFFSGAAAALTAATIYSNGMIFRESAFYIPIAVLAVITMLAFRFPRAAGFPLIIISGIFIVWLGLTILRFPVINDSGLVRVNRELNGLVRVMLVSQNETGHNRTAESGFTGESGVITESGVAASFYPPKEDAVLEFRSYCLSLSKIIPLIGGVTRGVIAEIRCDNEIYYTDPGFGKKLFPGLGVNARLASKRFLSIWEIPAKLELRKLRPGEGLTVFLNETELVFR